MIDTIISQYIKHFINLRWKVLCKRIIYTFCVVVFSDGY